MDGHCDLSDSEPTVGSASRCGCWITAASVGRCGCSPPMLRARTGNGLHKPELIKKVWPRRTSQTLSCRRRLR